MTETRQEYPTQVQCHICTNGGAIVTAGVGYQRVYHRAFESEVEARFAAAALFDRKFDVTDADDFEVDDAL